MTLYESETLSKLGIENSSNSMLQGECGCDYKLKKSDGRFGVVIRDSEGKFVAVA